MMAGTSDEDSLPLVPIVPVDTGRCIGVLFVAIFFLICTWTALSLRLYKRKVLKNVGWDDWVMLACVVRSPVHFVESVSPRFRSISPHTKVVL
jgi:hypothetical protein